MPLRSKLTPRQREVALLIPQGLSNRQIGDQLSIKESVVKNYLRSIFDRLGVFNRLELAVYVVQLEGSVPEPEVQPLVIAPPKSCRYRGSRLPLYQVPHQVPYPLPHHPRLARHAVYHNRFL